MFQIDKEDAVNKILAPLDGTTISTLEGNLTRNTLKAVAALEDAVTKIQHENLWKFNADGPRTITADDSGEIVLPAQYVYLHVLRWDGGHRSWLTPKGNKLYNRKDLTYNLGSTSVEISGHIRYTYEELPSVMQQLAIERGKLQAVGMDTHLSQARATLFGNELKEAYTAALKWDSEQDFGDIGIRPSIRDKVQTRNQQNWAGW